MYLISREFGGSSEETTPVLRAEVCLPINSVSPSTLRASHALHVEDLLPVSNNYLGVFCTLFEFSSVISSVFQLTGCFVSRVCKLYLM